MLSKIKPLFKGALEIWEGIMTFLSGLFALWGIKELWSEEGRQKYSLRARIGLSVFYLFHLGAIILASGLIGEALISAPLAIMLVSTTSLISDFYDYIQEYFQNYKQRRKLNELRDVLSENNIDFKEHVNFFEEITSHQDEIILLKEQRRELLELQNKINAPHENPARYLRELKNIDAILKQKNYHIINEQEVIESFYSAYGYDDINEYQIIQNSEVEANFIHNRKKELQERLERLQPNTSSTFEKTRLEKEISMLDTDVRRLTIINQHFYKLKMSKQAIKDAQEKLKDLDKKYRQEPFCDLAQKDKLKMKALEKQYLEGRIATLTKTIDQSIFSSACHRKAATLSAEKKSVRMEDLSESDQKASLSNKLRKQLNRIDKMLETLENNLKEKQKYIQLFSIDPKQALPKDLSNIFNAARAVLEIQNQLELSELEEKHKLWSTQFSIFTVAIAFILCYCASFLVVSSILTNVMRFFGVMAGFSGLYGFFESRLARRQLRNKEEEQLQGLILDCRNRAFKVSDPKARSALDNKLVSIISKLERNKHSTPCSSEQSFESAPITHQYMAPAPIQKRSRAASNRRTTNSRRHSQTSLTRRRSPRLRNKRH